MVYYRPAAPQEKTPQEDFPPPPLNAAKPPGPAPDGMVWIPGGWFWMGAEDWPQTLPIHKVYVDGFWMDKTEVTNAQFAEFVKATGYVTIAERKPDASKYLREKDAVLPEVAKGPYSHVFSLTQPSARAAVADPRIPWWWAVPGASWRHPEGPTSDLRGRENHPAVHIAWFDAVAYAEWAKKRLPTEAEWEFAARGGLNRKAFCWGDEATPQGKFLANYWQGRFPYLNTKEDGFEGTAPVGSYPPNGYGLYDMAGNAWEWCADWYKDDYYQESPERNPQGPEASFNPDEPGTPFRVQRGGSFLCADSYCQRYVPGARHAGDPASPAAHSGFRCVRSPR
jgi:formylglycine-generating enzyme required for sulfatase activity